MRKWRYCAEEGSDTAATAACSAARPPFGASSTRTVIGAATVSDGVATGLALASQRGRVLVRVTVPLGAASAAGAAVAATPSTDTAAAAIAASRLTGRVVMQDPLFGEASRCTPQGSEPDVARGILTQPDMSDNRLLTATKS